MKSILAALLSLFLLTPALAQQGEGRIDLSGVSDRIVVGDDFGGSVVEYIQKYTTWRRGDAKIEVDGWCISACTFILGSLDKKNVCVSDHAWFGFHSAHDEDGGFAGTATRLFWFMYPAWLQEKLKALGWDGSGNEPHPDLVYIRGTELYPLCGS